MARVNTIYGSVSQVEAIKKFVSMPSYSGSGDLHVLYKTWFNLVDIGDHYWYAAVDHHANQRWKSKMLFSIMHHFMTNVWVLSILQQDSTWMDFRAKLASVLVE
jgi:divalent metal cation (Fe/Co/Zn/Cd) transporter